MSGFTARQAAAYDRWKTTPDYDEEPEEEHVCSWRFVKSSGDVSLYRCRECGREELN